MGFYKFPDRVVGQAHFVMSYAQVEVEIPVLCRQGIIGGRFGPVIQCEDFEIVVDLKGVDIDLWPLAERRRIGLARKFSMTLRLLVVCGVR